jgi:signal transduction histidine kinase
LYNYHETAYQIQPDKHRADAGFFFLSSLSYYYLIDYLILKELDQSLVKTEKRIREYALRNNNLPAASVLDDLRINYTPSDSSSNFHHFRLIEPIAVTKPHSHIQRELSFFVQVKAQRYKVTIARNLEGSNSLLRIIIRATIVTILILLTASLLVNRLVFRRLWRPFYDTLHALNYFHLGRNNRVQLPVTSIDEFNFMNSNIEKLKVRLDNEYISLKEFTENASHEMQTPLSIIRSKIDLTIQDQGLSEKQTITLGSAYAAVKKLSSLNKSLLLIAKIENNQFEANDVLDIRKKLDDKIRQFQELWNTEIKIGCILEEASLIGNADLMDILLNNLFSNASKHNIPGGNINIELRPCYLSISNTGKQQALDNTRLFKRFYREASNGEHNGLGLSIVKQICELSNIQPAYQYKNGVHTFIFIWKHPHPGNNKEVIGVSRETSLSFSEPLQRPVTVIS